MNKAVIVERLCDWSGFLASTLFILGLIVMSVR